MAPPLSSLNRKASGSASYAGRSPAPPGADSTAARSYGAELVRHKRMGGFPWITNGTILGNPDSPRGAIPSGSLRPRAQPVSRLHDSAQLETMLL